MLAGFVTKGQIYFDLFLFLFQPNAQLPTSLEIILFSERGLIGTVASNIHTAGKYHCIQSIYSLDMENLHLTSEHAHLTINVRLDLLGFQCLCLSGFQLIGINQYRWISGAASSCQFNKLILSLNMRQLICAPPNLRHKALHTVLQEPVTYKATPQISPSSFTF